MRVLVIGGTLFVGRQLVMALLQEGHEVSVLHRKNRHNLGKKVDNLVADRNDAESMRNAIMGRRFDAVFDNVYDWERGTTAAQVEATAQVFSDSLLRYVFMSSVAAYGDGLNHHEDDPLAPEDFADSYARNKASSERALFRLHQRTGLPVITLRPPFIYGPMNPLYREAFFWDRLRAKRPLILPGDGGRLMQFAYVKDVVAACLNCLTTPNAVGEAFNVANEKPVTQLEVLTALSNAAGKRPEIVRVPRDRILEAGGNPMGEPSYFGVYFDLPPITQVAGKVRRVLKVQLTPFDQGLKETYRWYLRNHKVPKFDPSFEDKLIEMSRNGLVANEF